MRIPIHFDLDFGDDEHSIEEQIREDIINTIRFEVQNTVRNSMEEWSLELRAKIAAHMQARMDVVFQKLVDDWDAKDDDFITDALLGAEDS